MHVMLIASCDHEFVGSDSGRKNPFNSREIVEGVIPTAAHRPSGAGHESLPFSLFLHHAPTRTTGGHGAGGLFERLRRPHDADHRDRQGIRTGRQRGGGGNITITGTTPGELPRGAANVDLTILGSGFEPGSDVAFEIDGAAAEGVTTNSVTFVDESTLVANVDVSADAVETFYDVAVRNGPKKKGVGVDLLKIVPDFVVPILEGTPVAGDLTDPAIYDAADGLLLGRDDVCGFVFDLATESKHCITVPGLDPRTVVKAINESGRIVGFGYRVEGGGGATSQVPFVLDWPGTDPMLLPIPNDWQGASVEAINTAGDLVGELAREHVAPCGRNRTCAGRQYALVRWNPDGSIAAVSAVSSGSARVGHGLSDGGHTVGVFDQEAVFWDGQDGSTPVPLDDGGLGAVQGDALHIGPDGAIFGYANLASGPGSRILHWASPAGAPSIYADLDLTLRGVEAVRDAGGNVLARDETDGSTLCIAPDGHRTRLATPAGGEWSYAEVTEGGRAFGKVFFPDPNAKPGSLGTIGVLHGWDVSGGC